ncbi:MAG: acyloxyacyl hydrolase [Gammaproteobacteria bacterium]|nr:acyloxyacyl hydrolase [Gammaproteobacteria bacterium]
MSFKKIALVISAAMLCSSAYAMQNVTQGLAFSYGGHFIANSQPKDTSGYKIDYDAMPSNWTWYNNSVVAYVQANYAHWHTNNATGSEYNTIGVVGVAPVARWYFMAPTSNVAPYAEASVGLAALSHNSFGDRNLGTRLLFQDMAGIGATFGQSKQVFASLNFLHYSNASTHKDNDGVTIPLMLTVGYNFS